MSRENATHRPCENVLTDEEMRAPIALSHLVLFVTTNLPPLPSVAAEEGKVAAVSSTAELADERQPPRKKLRLDGDAPGASEEGRDGDADDAANLSLAPQKKKHLLLFIKHFTTTTTTGSSAATSGVVDSTSGSVQAWEYKGCRRVVETMELGALRDSLAAAEELNGDRGGRDDELLLFEVTCVHDGPKGQSNESFPNLSLSLKVREISFSFSLLHIIMTEYFTNLMILLLSLKALAMCTGDIICTMWKSAFEALNDSGEYWLKRLLRTTSAKWVLNPTSRSAQFARLFFLHANDQMNNVAVNFRRHPLDMAYGGEHTLNGMNVWKKNDSLKEDDTTITLDLNKNDDYDQVVRRLASVMQGVSPEYIRLTRHRFRNKCPLRRPRTGDGGGFKWWELHRMARSAGGGKGGYGKLKYQFYYEVICFLFST